MEKRGEQNFIIDKACEHGGELYSDKIRTQFPEEGIHHRKRWEQG